MDFTEKISSHVIEHLQAKKMFREALDKACAEINSYFSQIPELQNMSADIEAVTGAYKFRVSGLRVSIDLNEAIQQIKTANMQSQEEINLLAKQIILKGLGVGDI